MSFVIEIGSCAQLRPPPQQGSANRDQLRQRDSRCGAHSTMILWPSKRCRSSSPSSHPPLGATILGQVLASGPAPHGAGRSGSGSVRAAAPAPAAVIVERSLLVVKGRSRPSRARRRESTPGFPSGRYSPSSSLSGTWRVQWPSRSRVRTRSAIPRAPTSTPNAIHSRSLCCSAATHSCMAW